MFLAAARFLSSGKGSLADKAKRSYRQSIILLLLSAPIAIRPDGYRGHNIFADFVCVHFIYIIGIALHHFYSLQRARGHCTQPIKNNYLYLIAITEINPGNEAISINISKSYFH